MIGCSGTILGREGNRWKASTGAAAPLRRSDFWRCKVQPHPQGNFRKRQPHRERKEIFAFKRKVKETGNKRGEKKAGFGETIFDPVSLIRDITVTPEF